MDDHSSTGGVRRGRLAEDIAASWCRLRGMEILDRNRRAGRGEVDLVVRDGLTLVFVEVRARHAGARVPAAASIRRGKWERLRSCARALVREPALNWPGRRLRLDAIVVEIRPDGLELRHLRNLIGPATGR